MRQTIISFFGYTGGFLTTVACIPQVVKSWRSRSVGDLSLGMLVAINIGVAMWIVYGITHPDWPIFFTNFVSIGLWSSLLWLKLRYGSEKEQQEPGAR
jgi:MtN3 and saliva related transmembrane protein